MKAFSLFSLLLFSLPFFHAAADDTPPAPDAPWTLQACIDFALKNAPSLKRQRIALHSQQCQIVIEQAAFDWNLNASDSFTRQRPDNANSASVGLHKEFDNGVSFRTTASASHTNHSDYTDSTLSFQLSKQLLGGGTALEARYGVEAAVIDGLVALNTLKRAERKMVLDVTQAYYTIIRAQQSLTVKQRALENAKQNLAITKEREKPLDILTAELRIPENELSVNSAKRTIANGLDSLKELMGLDVQTTFSITGDFDYQVQTIDAENDLAFANDNLETILNNRLEQKKLDMQAKIRDSNMLPDVSLSATHQNHGNGNGVNFEGKDEQIISLSLNWTIGRRADSARLTIAQNNLERNDSEFFTLCQELAADIANYKRRLDEYARAVELQEQQCNLFKRQEDLYRDKWENGEIDILELVRTQTNLENSYVDLINSKIDYLDLLANYMYLIGK